MGTWVKYAATPMATNVGGYWLYTPTGASASSACIIAFHGLGEQGSGSSSDLDLLLNQGLSKLINDRMGGANEFPYNAYVVCPQYTGGTLTSGRTQAVIDYVQANLTFDLNKLHMTGLSLGAEVITNWWFNGNLTEVASCLMYSTPSQYYADGANNAVAANMPCMFVHGTADSNPFTPYTRSERWVNGFVDNGWPGLNGLGIQPPAILVTATGYDHNTWNDGYDWLQSFYYTQPHLTWMLSNSRGSATLVHEVLYRPSTTLFKLLLYSDNTWVQQQFISGAWTPVSKQAMQVRWKVGSTLYRANLTTANYTML